MGEDRSGGRGYSHQEVFHLAASLLGQRSVVTLHRSLVAFMGEDISSAIFLSQISYWTERSRNGWVAKSYDEWHRETSLTEYAVRRAANKCVKMGILKTDVRKFNGAPMLHYRLLTEAFTDSYIDFLKTENRKKMEESDRDGGPEDTSDDSIPRNRGIDPSISKSRSFDFKETNKNNEEPRIRVDTEGEGGVPDPSKSQSRSCESAGSTLRKRGSDPANPKEPLTEVTTEVTTDLKTIPDHEGAKGLPRDPSSSELPFSRTEVEIPGNGSQPGSRAACPEKMIGNGEAENPAVVGSQTERDVGVCPAPATEIARPKRKSPPAMSEEQENSIDSLIVSYDRQCGNVFPREVEHRHRMGVSPGRRRMIKTCLKEYPLAWWADLFDEIAKDRNLRNSNTWQPTFGWLISKNKQGALNAVSIRERLRINSQNRGVETGTRRAVDAWAREHSVPLEHIQR